jgi:hypothetical protein
MQKGEVTIFDGDNTWVLTAPETVIILDAKTKRLRRYKNYNHKTYIGMEFDEEGRITFFKYWDVEGYLGNTNYNIYARLTYTPEGQLESYGDNEGHHWERDWGIPFLHVDELASLYERINYFNWRINLKLKTIIRNAPTPLITPKVTIRPANTKMLRV